MKILYLTQPVLIGEDMVFYIHTECSCGKETMRYVSVPFGRTPILICIVCQEKCPIQFPVN